MRVPWTARRSKQFILKETNSEYSLEGLMLKLKNQYSIVKLKNKIKFKKIERKLSTEELMLLNCGVREDF